MKLQHRILGEGKPLIILHGLFGSADNWLTHAKHFSEYFQVILVDQRNHGHSPWSDDFNYEILAADLFELITDLNLTKVNLLGHSMGGKTVLRFAQKHSDLIEKAIVVDMGIKAYPLHHQQILAGIHAVNQSPMNARALAEEILQQFVPEIGTRQFLLKNLYWIEKGKLAWRMNTSVLEARMNEILCAMPEIETFVEILFIKGGLSQYILDEDQDSIEHSFPLAEFVTIEQAGHWVHAEKPEEFANTVLEYLLR